MTDDVPAPALASAPAPAPASAPAPGRYYADIIVGEVRESQARTVTLEELLEFATRYDPQYFHADPVAARDSAGLSIPNAAVCRT